MLHALRWPLLAVMASALSLPACKKDGETKPPEPAADTTGDAGDKPEAGGEKVDGADFLTVNVFEEVVVANTDDILECFQDTREKQPALASGKLILDFTVGADGMVSDLKADDTSAVKNDDLNACVKERTKGWKFPKTRDGQPMTLPYTFALN